jgi:conserved oligomeric Golgi complex subunit 3
MHLLYTRFTTVAGQLSPLLREFERRVRAHPEELGALLSECYAAYFGARKSLLVSRLGEQIRGLDPGRTELVELVRFLLAWYHPSVRWSCNVNASPRRALGAAT